MSELVCGYDFFHVPDITACLVETLENKYKFMSIPVINPRFRRRYIVGNAVVPNFTRSDMLLNSQDWTVKVVAKISSYIDVDIKSSIARRRNEDCLNEELTYCKGVGVPAVMLTLRNKNNLNLARILLNYFNGPNITALWIRIPMVCSHKHTHESSTDTDDDTHFNSSWRMWSEFHQLMGFEKNVHVVLEISEDLPSQSIIDRWQGEPIRCIALSTSLFHTNKKGFPVLSKAHQAVVQSFYNQDCQVLVYGAQRSPIIYYSQYLQHLWDRRTDVENDPMFTYAKGWEDYLQIPLQPLADNLDTHTYDVFEKDPVKYDQYQKAIAAALLQLQSESRDVSSDESPGDVDTVCSKTFTIMVLGAGRGPLVRAVLNAATITKSKVKVYAVEKNPCAVVVLEAQARELWFDKDVTVLSGDMRKIKPPAKADIIVSELLGSWGDNELSPECLDGAANLLRPGGISIPQKYTSYIAPILSPRLWAATKSATVNTMQINPDRNMEILWVVYMKSKHVLGKSKPVFTFDHPSEGVRDMDGSIIKDNQGNNITDNRRHSEITWTAENEAVIHGFGGYFDCHLYGGEMISIVPETHSPGMISWFPVFIPIKTPLRVKKGDTITANFWRCVSNRKVWYEWSASAGDMFTPIHNVKGRSSEMLL